MSFADRYELTPLALLTPIQEAVVEARGSSFLRGIAGSGKSTALRQRILHFLREGEPAYTILTIVAEPEHAAAYEATVQHSGLGAYADLNITTYNQMAQEMVRLFWPLIARRAGFVAPFRPPTMLTYDLAQLLMWRVLEPFLQGGAFADLRLRPQQIVSQILDTLNRAALNGLDLEEAITRQQATWSGEEARLLHLEDAAAAARAFRNICLRNGLLDLSMLVEVFDVHLVQDPEFHRYFSERYRHLIVDNIEEQTPAGQNFLSSLMDLAETTALAYDEGGGYKRFLAADPVGANQFQSRCQSFFRFEQSFLAPPEMAHLANLVENDLLGTKKPITGAGKTILGIASGRYRREMVADLVPRLAAFLDRGIAPDQIAIITPYLDEALRYMLTVLLNEARLPYRFLRRRRSPREEPRVRAWLTWLALAHPHWQVAPSAYDVAEALTLSIDGLDPGRAELVTRHLYRPEEVRLLPADDLPAPIRERAGEEALARVEELRLWLENEDANTPIDVSLHNLFNQLLAWPRFQPQPDIAGAAVCDWLVRVATRLHDAAAPMGLHGVAEVGRAFIECIYQGLVTANPPDLGEPPEPLGITISTIYGYLLAGPPVRVQVWLETAATGWWDIPRQPLSNAFVLAQSYDPQQPWTMAEDFAVRNELLSNIVRGLTARCRDGIVLAHSDLDRRGVRQEGRLWRALQPLLKPAG